MEVKLRIRGVVGLALDAGDSDHVTCFIYFFEGRSCSARVEVIILPNEMCSQNVGFSMHRGTTLEKEPLVAFRNCVGVRIIIISGLHREAG